MFHILVLPLLGHVYVLVEAHHKDVFAVDAHVSAESQNNEY